jgi:FdrA protein
VNPTHERVEVRPGVYRDSVTLMQVSRDLSAAPGVVVAQVAMATELNVDILAGMGFARPEGLSPADLLIAVRAVDERAALDALAGLDRMLAGSVPPAATAADVPPRTVGAAARRIARLGPDAPGLALISVPGEHAFTEAVDALEAGLHVVVFSDNVSVEDEVRLKDIGAARGLLVMGPDCGTAVVGGVGLGFANVVAPGPVGLVAASGTGAQHLMALLDGAGVGVSQCLGVGGRDLSAAVAGRSTMRAMSLLDADPATEMIVVVSKPPDPAVEDAVRAHAAGLRTPVRFALLSAGRPDLTQAARGVAEAVGARWTPPRSWRPPGWAPAGRAGVLRGAFCGGTLCDEAMAVLSARLGPIASNIPLAGAPALAPATMTGAGEPHPREHVCVDFGADELTRGRPHPMIDSSLRMAWLARQAADPDVRVLLLDVVLGHGAHPDPAADLATAIADFRAEGARAGRDLAVVVSLCGTAGDPQGLDRQAEALAAAGAAVFASNAEAAAVAAGLVI